MDTPPLYGVRGGRTYFVYGPVSYRTMIVVGPCRKTRGVTHRRSPLARSRTGRVSRPSVVDIIRFLLRLGAFSLLTTMTRGKREPKNTTLRQLYDSQCHRFVFISVLPRGYGVYFFFSPYKYAFGRRRRIIIIRLRARRCHGVVGRG